MSLSLPALTAILQTTDPLFPIGSYAHSYGLEQLCLEERVSSQADLIQYLDTVVKVNLQEFELPYLRFLYDSIQREEWNTTSELDQEIAASKPCQELRQASANQGKQRLRLLSKLRASATMTRLNELRKAQSITPHHLTIFAAENVDLQTPLEATLATWAYQALAAPCAASLKLIRIGQEGAQQALSSALISLETLVERSMQVERDFAGAFLPHLDIASQRHEHAYARLFIS